MRVLLDTCTFLWLVESDDALSDYARETFADPNNDVFLSAVSAWEISVKHGLGKLTLKDPPAKFVVHERQRRGITALPLAEDAALQVARLPLHHKDPFDRMLICQALVDGLVLLTPDPLFQPYPVRSAW